MEKLSHTERDMGKILENSSNITEDDIARVKDKLPGDYFNVSPNDS